MNSTMIEIVINSSGAQIKYILTEMKKYTVLKKDPIDQLPLYFIKNMYPFPLGANPLSLFRCLYQKEDSNY